jgi:hypothetical protein
LIEKFCRFTRNPLELRGFFAQEKIAPLRLGELPRSGLLSTLPSITIRKLYFKD